MGNPIGCSGGPCFLDILLAKTHPLRDWNIHMPLRRMLNSYWYHTLMLPALAGIPCNLSSILVIQAVTYSLIRNEVDSPGLRGAPSTRISV